MQRCRIAERAEWREQVESLGFFDHSFEGRYWDESVYYRFSEQEVDQLRDCARELHSMCLRCVDEVISYDLFEDFDIPVQFVPLIIRSWERKDLSLFGRFDFAFDGSNLPKMLEYNADCPGTLLESSTIQFDWQQARYPTLQQFNHLRSALTSRWKSFPFHGKQITFTSLHGREDDLSSTRLLQDSAIAAGLHTEYVQLEELGWNPSEQRFVNQSNEPIDILCKLYPWEWLLGDAFGVNVLSETNIWIEPPWKLLLSCKGILPVLWKQFPGHQNLLRSFNGLERQEGVWVSKPLYGRYGRNVQVVTSRASVTNSIFQEYAPLYHSEGVYAVVSVWMVGDEPCGLSVRESEQRITGVESRFVPHVVA